MLEVQYETNRELSQRSLQVPVQCEQNPILVKTHFLFWWCVQGRSGFWEGRSEQQLFHTLFRDDSSEVTQLQVCLRVNGHWYTWFFDVKSTWFCFSFLFSDFFSLLLINTLMKTSCSSSFTFQTLKTSSALKPALLISPDIYWSLFIPRGEINMLQPTVSRGRKQIKNFLLIIFIVFNGHQSCSD